MTNEELLNLRGGFGRITKESRAAIVLHMDQGTNVEITAVGTMLDQSFLLAQLQVFLNEILSGRLRMPQQPQGGPVT